MNIGLNLVGFIQGRWDASRPISETSSVPFTTIDQENRYVVLCNDHYKKEIRLFNNSFKFKSINYTQLSFLWLVRGVLLYVTMSDTLRPTLVRVMPVTKSGETVGLGGGVQNN